LISSKRSYLVICTEGSQRSFHLLQDPQACLKAKNLQSSAGGDAGFTRLPE
jgi:hypothetical protein